MSSNSSSGEIDNPLSLPEPSLVVLPDSVTLHRLIEEVELGKEINHENYNRTYHRHNR
jgi:hypothetical protein